jgi:hypothetical protein
MYDMDYIIQEMVHTMYDINHFLQDITCSFKNTSYNFKRINRTL